MQFVCYRTRIDYKGVARKEVDSGAELMNLEPALVATESQVSNSG